MKWLNPSMVAATAVSSRAWISQDRKRYGPTGKKMESPAAVPSHKASHSKRHHFCKTNSVRFFTLFNPLFVSGRCKMDTHWELKASLSSRTYIIWALTMRKRLWLGMIIFRRHGQPLKRNTTQLLRECGSITYCPVPGPSGQGPFSYGRWC